MRKKNRDFRKKNSNLGIKVGDWFEDISGSERGLKDFYMVKSLNQTSVRFVEIGTDDGELSEVLCGDYDINNFKKVKNILEYDLLKLKKIGGDEARNRLKKVNGVSLILECFGVDKKKVSSQNPSSSIQSTAPENKPKTAVNLDIKVGDWFEIPQIYAESKGKDRRFLRVEKVTDLNIEFKEVNIEPTNPDVDHTLEIDERPWFIKYFHKNADGTFFWETERDGRLDFERRNIDVVRKEVTCCLNLGVEDELQRLGLLKTSKKENNLSKSCGQLWKRFKDLEGKYIKYYNGYGIQYLKVREVDYDSENYELHISGFGPYLRRGTHDVWTNYDYTKETVLQGYLLQAEEISKEEFKKAKEMLREKLSHEKTIRSFLEKDEKPLTDLVGKYLKYNTQDDRMGGTEYFRLKSIQIETCGDYQYCNIQYENNRFSINKKGGITYLTGENIHDSISFESLKDAVIITEEEFNKARSGEGFKKQEKPIKIYTKEELKSSILKYTSPDGSIYYLEHPEIPKVGIENKPGKFKYCVVSYGIMISNGGQVHFYSPKINPFNPIVLLIESESDEGFFSRVEEIPDHEWVSLKKFYQDKIVKI